MWQYNDTNELYHYGVLGMKWGKHRSSEQVRTISKNKTAYKNAKKAYRDEIRATPSYGIGIKGIKKAQQHQAALTKRDMKVLETKAKYKGSKSKDANKAEMKVYRKAMSKTGLPGSYKDSASGGRSTNIYNSLKAQKGKAAADKIQQKVQDNAYRDFAIGSAVTIAAGAAYMAYVLKS